MRPLELRLRNFRSYFGPDVVFDFRGRRLVGIVGPIGSGKSSILDAISYALYGRTPTVARSTKALIHQRADGGAVALRFTVKGQVWEVVRSLRQRGQSQHALYRLQSDEEGAEALEKITLEGEVNSRIVELLGLEFDAFGRSVLLAQGRFAEFLSARPGDRDNVLKGVFGHERIDAMREVAKERAKVAEAEAEKVAFQVQQLEARAERLVLARSELVDLEQRTAALEKAEPELAAIEERHDAAALALEAAQQRLLTLDEVAGELPDRKAALVLLDAAGQAAEIRATAASAMTDTAARLDEAEQRLSELEDSGERAVLEKATTLLAIAAGKASTLAEAEVRQQRAVNAVSEVEERIKKLTDRVTEANSSLAAMAGRLATAKDAELAARNTLHAAEHADMAATLRGDLAAGAPCPVCEQTVTSIPSSALGDVSSGAKAALEAASATVGKIEAEHRSHADQASEVATLLAAATEERRDRTVAAEEAATSVAAVAQELANDREQLSELLDVTADHQKALTARRAALEAAVEATTLARKAAQAARASLDEAIEAEQRTQQNVAALRVAVAEVGARLGVESNLSDDALAALRNAVPLVHSRVAEEQKEHAEAAAASKAELESAAAARSQLLDHHDVTGSLAAELGAATARSEERTAEIKRLEVELEAGESLIASRDRLVEARNVMQRLASDLTDSRFIRFLLDEERGVLSELGSQHLLRLTSGRYEFDDSGAFNILDLTAADAVRKADSLSGGETFLASLALALALAEMVARTGGRLDAFFLDEGFGSLDPEHLDLAMEGIESLVADDHDRLVVVVSHVPELRHRIEDIIELDRSPTTGDTRVIRA